MAFATWCYQASILSRCFFRIMGDGRGSRSGCLSRRRNNTSESLQTCLRTSISRLQSTPGSCGCCCSFQLVFAHFEIGVRTCFCELSPSKITVSSHDFNSQSFKLRVSNSYPNAYNYVLAHSSTIISFKTCMHAIVQSPRVWKESEDLNI